MPAKPVAWLLGALGAIVMTGCSPQYRTFTAYAPPQDEGGRQCLMQCQHGRQFCRQGISFEARECRASAQDEAQMENIRLMAEYHVALRQFEAGYAASPPEPPRTVRPDYWGCDQRASGMEGQCTADYDLCYQNCGGQVTYTTRCVANCEDAPGS